MSAPLLAGVAIPFTLIIGLLLLLVGIVFGIKPTLSLRPFGKDVGHLETVVGLWGRLVAAVFFLLGGLMTVIGVWNLLYA